VADLARRSRTLPFLFANLWHAFAVLPDMAFVVVQFGGRELIDARRARITSLMKWKRSMALRERRRTARPPKSQRRGAMPGHAKVLEVPDASHCQAVVSAGRLTLPARP
jgi:hypothetical protein